MHRSAKQNAIKFAQKYINMENPSILDVGSYDVNGNLRDAFPANSTYTGLDMENGPNVDYLMSPDYRFPFNNEEFDFIVSSSCFEHCDFFWLVFLEMVRCLRKGGYIYINAPSAGAYHAYPKDYYRFYKDTGEALTKWANYNGYSCRLAESYIDTTEGWRDNVTIIQKL